MDPLIGGMLTAGAGLIGNIFSSDTSAQNTQANIAAQEAMQQQTQQFNAQQAQMNRDWQSQMSNTAYQRAVQDMKKSGLNPAMMFGHGAAESTPGGAQASTSSPNMALSQNVSPLGNLGQVVSQAISSANAVQQLDNQAADAAKKKQETETEKWRTLHEANEASKSGLSLPKACREAQEEAYIQDLPDQEKRAAAQAPYAGRGFGHYGQELYAPVRSAITGLGEVVNKMVDQVTGPTGQAIWQKARNVWDRWGYRSTGMDDVSAAR